jgi:chemotaxis protein methyltransferase CheR
LGLSSLASYRDHLQTNPAEWLILDGLSRVSISRFYRDKRVFSLLEQVYLPDLARRVMEQGGKTLRVWSVGCASGEEPYTLNLLWEFALLSRFPGLELQILATDADAALLLRAREACYGYSSIKNLPEVWRERAFFQVNTQYCLHDRFRTYVEFHQHDVRDGVPDGPYHLVMCRNLVFTYFDNGLQHAFLDRLQQNMSPQGLLLLGVHEQLPEAGHDFIACSTRWGYYRLRSSWLQHTRHASHPERA